ncbi:MAG TPA: CoA transferase, partial [Tepidiformaceae bacterium]|nr:CoA transferase [Tepidiformaceae bacterium]
MEANSLLQGIRVLEVGGGVSVPYAGRLLASLGAEVVHVECDLDESLRAEGPFPPEVQLDGGGLFQYLHTGKTVVRSSLASAAGRAELFEAAKRADIVLDSFGLDECEGSQPDWYALHRAHPLLASVTVTPFGQTGPYRGYQATELLAFLTFGRFSDAGLSGRPPIGYSSHAAGFYAGTIAASAALAALRHARHLRMPIQADVAIAECILASPDRAFTLYAFAGRPLPRPESHREVFYLTREGSRVLINTGLAWDRTARMLGRDDLLGDPRFTTLSARVLHGDEIYALVANWAIERTVDEIMDALGKYRVLGGPMYSPSEVGSDRHYKARQFFDTLSVLGAPAVQVPGVPYRVNGQRPRMRPLQRQTATSWGDRLDEIPSGPASRVQPLTGIRVIDLGELYAGPSACSLLADLGADVIKIENVQRMPAVVRGDLAPPSPAFGYFHGDPGETPWERFHLFHTVERNKRGITLDLKSEDGRTLFLELVAKSDIVVSNYTPRALEHLNLAANDLRQAKSDLVFVHLPGFGADGPYADHVSVGPVAEALSGHWAARGYPDAPELQSNQTVWADSVAAATACFLALGGLTAHDREGMGSAFDLSQAEALSCFIAADCIEWGWNGIVPSLLGDKHTTLAPHGCYRAKGDDRWVALAVRS